MAKKAQNYAEAERLYITDQLTLSAVAAQLGLSERTVWEWKSQGKWDEKRAKYFEVVSSAHESLYELLKDLTKKVGGVVKEGKDPNQAQLYFIGKIAPLLIKLKSYEEEVGKESAPAEGLSEETLQRINDLLGISNSK